MKVNFDRPFTNLKGEPVKVDGKDINIGQQLALMLFGMLSTEKDKMMDAKSKMEAYSLMWKLQKGGDIEISIEEASVIKTITVESMSIGIFGQVMEIIGELSPHSV